MTWPTFARLKYGNRKVEQDGYRFDSRREAARYQELVLLERAGQIQDLEVHPKYPLVVEGVRIGDYVGDFAYTEAGRRVVEDVKSAPTRRLASYRIKRKLMRALYHIEIVEIE